MKQDVVEGKNILSNNRLIAEFIGCKYVYVEEGVECMDFIVNGKLQKRQRIETLKYHTSWDWLMPACKKFDELPDEFTGLNTRAHYECHCDSIDQSLMLYDINMTWQELVYAITWYNSLKQ